VVNTIRIHAKEYQPRIFQHAQNISKALYLSTNIYKNLHSSVAY